MGFASQPLSGPLAASVAFCSSARAVTKLSDSVGIDVEARAKQM